MELVTTKKAMEEETEESTMADQISNVTYSTEHGGRACSHATRPRSGAEAAGGAEAGVAEHAVERGGAVGVESERGDANIGGGGGDRRVPLAVDHRARTTGTAHRRSPAQLGVPALALMTESAATQHPLAFTRLRDAWYEYHTSKDEQRLDELVPDLEPLRVRHLIRVDRRAARFHRPDAIDAWELEKILAELSQPIFAVGPLHRVSLATTLPVVRNIIINSVPVNFIV
uniref:Uncharacterized protein n=1 Tax=Leersia perrieri TaxID=77586 RepID=A0A0D9WX58_9ORYZ